MKKLARKMVAVVCAFSLLMGTGTVPVLAEEIGQEESIVSENIEQVESRSETTEQSEESTEEIEFSESLNADGTEKVEKKITEEQINIESVEEFELESSLDDGTLFLENSDISTKEESIRESITDTEGLKKGNEEFISEQNNDPDIEEVMDGELVGASDITVFSQLDSRWAGIPYGKGPEGNTTLGPAGCGVFAYINAIYYLNGSFIEPAKLAEYSVNNGHRINGQGTSESLYKAFADDYGASYGFAYDTKVKTITDARPYLEKGDTAALHVQGHWVALVDYDSSNGKYLVLDSYKSSNRGTSPNGYRWMTASQFTGKMARAGENSVFLFKATGTSSPSNLSISTDKKNYRVGENVTFSFSSNNATTLAIPIDVNGKREFFNYVNGQNSYTQSFNVPGVYGYFLYGYNDAGQASSEYKEFYVYNEKPKDLTINIDKTEYEVGEEVTFTFSSKYAKRLAIPIDVNGKREFFNIVTDQNSYKQSFNVPGVYGFFLHGNNEYGEASSEYKEFYVYNEAPKDLTISTDKDKYSVGEKVTFTFSSKYTKSLAIPIDVNGKREFFNHVEGTTTYTQSFNVPGTYGYFLYGTNSFGEGSSEYKEFTVSAKLPEDLRINTDKNEYAVGEEVKFTFSAKNVKTLAIPIDVNGKREFFNYVEGSTSYRQSFNVPGTYGYFLYGTNDYGNGSSEYKEFYVYNEKPKDLKIKVEKEKYSVGENVVFTFSGKYAKTLAIPIDVNDKREFFIHVDGKTSYKQSFKVPGKYGYFLYGNNEYGDNSSEYKLFYVVDSLSSSKTTISLSQLSYKYDGTLKKPGVTVKQGEITLKEGTDYSVSYSNNLNVGTASVTITGKGNYTGIMSKSFTISAASLSGAEVSGIAGRTYNGAAQTQSPTVKVGGRTLTNGTDYTLSYANNTNAGTATVTITGKGNYTGTVSKNFMISAASLSGAEVSGIAGRTYNGAAQTQNPTVKVGGRTLTNGTDYTLSYANNTNVGTATVTITGKGNYTGTISKAFTISAVSLAGAEVSGIAGRTYNGSAQTQSPTVKVGGRTLTNGTDYTLSYANNTNAGTATVTITGKGNYNGTVSKTFTISQAAPKLSFANAKVEKTTLSAPFTNTLTKTTDGTVSFTSGNTNVATVDNSGDRRDCKLYVR